jgi:hypothetical protein
MTNSDFKRLINKTMKKYICTRIKIAPDTDVAEIINETVTFKPGKSFVEIWFRSAVLLEKTYTSKGFDGVAQELSIKPVSQLADINKFQRQQHILQLTISDGRTVVFGSLNNAVKTESITNELGNFTATLIRITDAYEY